MMNFLFRSSFGRLFFALVLLTAVPIRAELMHHVVSVQGNHILLNNKPFDMWGIRVASATEDEQSLEHLIDQLDDYAAVGLNALAVYLMGSSGGAYDPFSPDGLTLDREHQARWERLIAEADRRGIVVVVGILYQHVPKGKIRLKDWEATQNTVRTVARWLEQYPHRNVILNIANEQNSHGYENKPWGRVQNPEDILQLCRLAKENAPKVLVGAGGYDLARNKIIGISPAVDILLFDTSKKEERSLFHFNEYKKVGIAKPMVNVEMFGAWTNQFKDGVFAENPDVQYFYDEADEVLKTEGLYTFFFAMHWSQGKTQGASNRYNLAGKGTSDEPGIRWFFEYVKRNADVAIP